MKRWQCVALSALLILATNGATVAVAYNLSTSRAATYQAEIASLNASLNAIGPIETCYTVSATTKPGQELTEEDIVEQSIPASFIGEKFVLSMSDIVGKYSKIAIDPGTCITQDLLMSEELDDTLRHVDIISDRWPVGLEVGNYIDVRLTLNGAQDFIVLSHVRVDSIGENSIQVRLTEEEILTYFGALVDFWVNADYGGNIWFTEYVEPGIQAPATAYYAIPADVQAIIAADPNVVDKAIASAHQANRPIIDAAWGYTYDELEDKDRWDFIEAGLSEYNDRVSNDYKIVYSEGEDGSSSDSGRLDPLAPTDEFGNPVPDEEDVQEVEDAIEDVQEAGEEILE